MVDTLRTLLINPPTPAYLPNKEFVLPLSLLYLGGTLEAAGFPVAMLDLNIYRPWEKLPGDENWWEALLIKAVSVQKPGLIGIGCLFSGQFGPVRQIATFLKARFPEAPIATGGMHPTVFAGEIIRHCPEIDYVVMGEGEPQTVALAKSLKEKDPGALTAIDGLAYRSSGRVLVRPKKEYMVDLDRLPLPAYHLTDFEAYRHDTSHWHNPGRLDFRMTVPILSSRSCPNRCSFCSMYQVMGPNLRTRSAKAVVEEIELLHDRYGQTRFSFMDDNLNLKRSHILGICNGIIGRGLQIQFETPNGLSVSHLDEEVMDAMVASGWIRGAIAIESGSDYIRNQVMGKRLSSEKIHSVVGYAKRFVQLYLKAFFIIGMPEETNRSLAQTYEMISSLCLDEVYVTNLMPFPGTRVFRQALRDSLFVKELDMEGLWQADGFHYHNNRQFYIKPYRMEMEELVRWRACFDDLVKDVRKRRRQDDDAGQYDKHSAARGL